MGQVIKMRGGDDVHGTASPMRQTGRVASRPVSQFVSIGEVVSILLARIEQDMNERAITTP